MYPERPACSALRSLSLREGVLAQASAVRPGRFCTDTEQTTRTHCAVYSTTRNRTPSLM